MNRQNRKNDGLDHCMPMPVSNNANKNNGGMSTPYNGSYNQIYTGIPQTILPDMGGNIESNRDTRSLSSSGSSGGPGSMPNCSNGMGGYSQPQIAGAQPMNMNGFQQFGQRPWMAVAPMSAPGGFSAPGGYQAPGGFSQSGGFPAPGMYSYNPMPAYPPIYPPNPYGAGMGWTSPVVAPTMPIDGYPSFNGEEFKILGYGAPNAEDPASMNYQNSQNSGNNNSSRNSRMR